MHQDGYQIKENKKLLVSDSRLLGILNTWMQSTLSSAITYRIYRNSSFIFIHDWDREIFSIMYHILYMSYGDLSAQASSSRSDPHI